MSLKQSCRGDETATCVQAAWASPPHSRDDPCQPTWRACCANASSVKKKTSSMLTWLALYLERDGETIPRHVCLYCENPIHGTFSIIRIRLNALQHFPADRPVSQGNVLTKNSSGNSVYLHPGWAQLLMCFEKGFKHINLWELQESL